MMLLEQIIHGIRLAPCFDDMTLIHMTDEEPPLKILYCPSEDKITISQFTGTSNAPCIKVDCIRESCSLDNNTIIELLTFFKGLGIDATDDNFQWHHEMKSTFFQLREDCTRALEVMSRV